MSTCADRDLEWFGHTEEEKSIGDSMLTNMLCHFPCVYNVPDAALYQFRQSYHQDPLHRFVSFAHGWFVSNKGL